MQRRSGQKCGRARVAKEDADHTSATHGPDMTPTALVEVFIIRMVREVITERAIGSGHSLARQRSNGP
jgi:hypothetical protein